MFFAAPLRRYDQFYSGILWGVFVALLLPCLVVVSGVLLVVVRGPLHVAAHLAAAVGFALLSLPLAHLVAFIPPFTEEPVRHARSRELVYSFIVLGADDSRRRHPLATARPARPARRHRAGARIERRARRHAARASRAQRLSTARLRRMTASIASHGVQKILACWP
jgi:hypothetical protein